jgi:ABC-type branched-subunit amino acid transport system substrate-binding protein
MAAPVQGQAGGGVTVVQGGGQAGAPPQPVVAQAVAGQIGTTPLAPGVTLQGGRYVVDRPLGTGGMGSVFLAHDTHVNNKTVVVKEMAAHYATAEERREAEEAFNAEMATLAALSHPNIPQISDFFTESGRHFAVQEFVGGQDLAKALESTGQPPRGLPEKQVLSWISQVLSVLDYLESQTPQVIHRDIKPGNIIVDAANRVKVVDFGIASHKFKAGTAPGAAPQVSTALGTPGYAPREQFTGQETPLSDLYALGATTHQLLTGVDPTKVADQKDLWKYAPVRTLNPKVSEATERIVARAVQNDPKKRYQSAAAMKRDVDRVLTPPKAFTTARSRATALLVIVVLLLAGAGGAYLYAQQQSHERPTGSVSDGGDVAFDTGGTSPQDQAALEALGMDKSDIPAWRATKIQASIDMAHGNTQTAIGEYQKAVTLNQSDAESAIAIEDQAALAAAAASGKSVYRVAVGGSFSPSPDGKTNNVSVGRQNLQGAYTAQHMINQNGGINGHPLYLVLANDSSTTTGAQGAARTLATNKKYSNVLAFIGFAWSSRTAAALRYVADTGIPEIAPTASNPGLAGSPYFFRVCPSDTLQGQADLNYLLDTLLKGKTSPTIAVFGDPSDTYASGLQTLVANGATARGATVIVENYTIGDPLATFERLARDIKAHNVDAVYFAGYAREALLLSQAMDEPSIRVPASVPIMSDDGFYDPSSFIANPTGKGRFHFTTYFFPDAASKLTGADRARVLAMEAAYTQNFHKLGVPLGGYGTSRVSSDTALYYDAVGLLADAIGRLPENGVTRQAIAAKLGSVGLSVPAYAGISGHIRYATAAQAATGDPIDKALVIMHLDALLGRSHLDGFLGTY